MSDNETNDAPAELGIPNSFGSNDLGQGSFFQTGKPFTQKLMEDETSFLERFSAGCAAGLRQPMAGLLYTPFCRKPVMVDGTLTLKSGARILLQSGHVLTVTQDVRAKVDLSAAWLAVKRRPSLPSNGAETRRWLLTLQPSEPSDDQKQNLLGWALLGTKQDGVWHDDDAWLVHPHATETGRNAIEALRNAILKACNDSRAQQAAAPPSANANPDKAVLVHMLAYRSMLAQVWCELGDEYIAADRVRRTLAILGQGLAGLSGQDIESSEFFSLAEIHNLDAAWLNRYRERSGVF